MPLSGVVVDNFSFVFQSTQSSKTITRAEMRALKKVWASCANSRTGYLERHNLGQFFNVRHLFPHVTPR
jgi:voltage-dependent calcium channel